MCGTEIVEELAFGLVVKKERHRLKRFKRAMSGTKKTADNKDPVVCSSCRVTIRMSSNGRIERMCLICHARMLNEYFRRVGGASTEARRRQ